MWALPGSNHSCSCSSLQQATTARPRALTPCKCTTPTRRPQNAVMQGARPAQAAAPAVQEQDSSGAVVPIPTCQLSCSVWRPACWQLCQQTARRLGQESEGGRLEQLTATACPKRCVLMCANAWHYHASAQPAVLKQQQQLCLSGMRGEFTHRQHAPCLLSSCPPLLPCDVPY